MKSPYILVERPKPGALRRCLPGASKTLIMPEEVPSEKAVPVFAGTTLPERLLQNCSAQQLQLQGPVC